MVEVFCDGGSRGNPGPAAWGFVLKVDGQITKEDCGYIGIATNNFAEYTALVEALSYLEENFEGGSARVYLDSKLVVSQLNGEYKIKNLNIAKLVKQARELEKSLGDIVYNHIPRDQNKEADKLVNIALNKNLYGA
ncbi:MAG: Ribonuclease H [Candidatus Curtissbacteria bacterium GW2011_GWA1_40_16]|uniref:Ribonuclease H n=1 Tax=Candidatus Curtissbacteria bacterium GW2011_GWA1_40_16 TaxID=1618405 RepID=A0A0G0R8E0_9BACT|nr:MAG: Ribonuclease H [Candidatus Curtissbacteria bacterium GW2011_GWA1_40_16]OGG09128.1 MAG: hypothetical protein A2699_06440 [Candidatus Gottesmanbacteria bacterium RIFCSPHIGHO2_01_FULL_43_15]